jgi:PIN domain nuclease of toxin-antitoxin system
MTVTAELALPLPSHLQPFDVDHALAVQILNTRIRDLRLSLGDRGCLALSKSLDVPVLT